MGDLQDVPTLRPSSSGAGGRISIYGGMGAHPGVFRGKLSDHVLRPTIVGIFSKRERPVKEHPLIFSAEMARAILDGRKSMTRRIYKKEVPGGLREKVRDEDVFSSKYA